MSTQRNTPLILTLVLVSLAATASVSQAEAVRWRSNLDAAKIEAAQSGKLVLLHFWKPSCGPCRSLDENVFSQPQIGEFLDQHFVPVKVNADLSPALAGRYQIDRVPSDIVLTQQGNVVAKLSCPLQADAYMGQLSNVASHYTQLMDTPSAPAQSPTQLAYGGLQVGQYNAQPTASSPPRVSPAAVTPAAAYTSNPFVGGPQAPTSTTPHGFNNPFAPAVAPTMASAAAPATPVAQQSFAAQQQPTPQSQIATPKPQLPPGSPALALDGYCPVTLKLARKWVVGNSQFGAVHRGCTFLFTSDAERKQFLASPDTYSPVFSGLDPVMMLDQNRRVEGSRKYGYEYRGSFYLFHSQETMAHFANDPVRYSAQIRQAMNRSDASAGGTILR
jgi:YHS domain-containing protein/thiol-disulfide isomerase/thioredoxin